MSRLALVLPGLFILLAAGCVIGIVYGPATIDAWTALRSIFTEGQDEATELVVGQFRLPRVAAALIAGACFGASGSLIQSATRNPLGDPQLFGVGSGAAIIQALAFAGIVSAGAWGLVGLSVAASMSISALIFLFASHEEITPTRLALIGVSVGALALAVTAGILAYARVFSVQAIFLISGSVSNRSWDDITPTLPFLLVGLVLAVAAAGRLNVLALGDRLAGHLGANPKRTRLVAMASAGVLAGAGVSVAGVVGFVGLLTPHLVRLLIGHDARMVLAISVPVGATMVLYADQIARLAFMPSEIPVGLVTTSLGAPLMIWIARQLR